MDQPQGCTLQNFNFYSLLKAAYNKIELFIQKYGKERS